MDDLLSCVHCKSDNLHTLGVSADGMYEERRGVYTSVYLWCEHCPGITKLSIESREGTTMLSLGKPANGWEFYDLNKVAKE